MNDPSPDLDRLEEHFHRLAALAPGERESALRALELGENAAFAAAMRDLLAAADTPSSPLDRPAISGGELTLADDLRGVFFEVEAPREVAPPAGEAEGAAQDRLPRVPGFAIQRRIGRGGSATVYLAEQLRPEFSRLVALKIVDRVIDATSLRRVEDERRILARLEHPGIARLYDAGVTPAGQPYLAMERVDGLSIFDHCSVRNLSVKERVELFLGVLEAVEFAHRAGVVHRDLKPGNILVTESGAVKLLDFGIAKLVAGPGEEAETLTQGRAMTLAYASPEQILGQRVSVASDVYSLGVVLYELLAETLPYRIDGVRFETYEDAVRAQDPEPPSAAITRTAETSTGERPSQELARRRRALKGDLDAVVLQALRKEPAARYGSADDFARDLRQVLGGRPVAARGANRRYRAARLVRRNWKRIAVGAALVAAAGLGALPELRQRLLLPLLTPAVADELSSHSAVRAGSPEARAAMKAGAEALRRFDAGAARAQFVLATKLFTGAAEQALAWDGLSRAETLCGEMGPAGEAATRAAAIPVPEGGLPADEAARIAARALSAGRDWPRAIAALDRLFGRAASRTDIGLDLVAALLASGQTEAANATLGRLAQLPALAEGANRDPRFDLAESAVAYRLGDHQRAAAAATRAIDWANRHARPTIRLRAERLHAEAVGRLDLQAEAHGDLTAIAAEMVREGMHNEAALTHLALARLFSRTGENARAQAGFEQALLALRAAGDAAGEARALVGLAFEASKGGDLQHGLGIIREAVELARAIGDRWCEGEALVIELVLANWSDDAEAVRELTAPTLAALRESANRQTLFATLNNLAIAEIERLELDAAESYLGEAALLAHRVGNRLADAGMDRAYAFLEESRGNLDLARQRYESALQKARRAEIPVSIATYLADLAGLEVAADRPEAAAVRAAEAIAAHRAVGRLRDAAELEGILAWVEARRGNAAAARAGLAAARLAAGEPPADPTLASLILEARIEEALGEWPRAVALRRRTLQMAEAQATAGPWIAERYALIVALRRAGRGDEARGLATDLLVESERRGARGVARGLRELLASPS
ncbi:MAG: serine/threonine protein kinase [Thermoanaerobaculia bacterium]|nr:serine/threonine protein kinase [Thermoanaerobaculia bacterium]